MYFEIENTFLLAALIHFHSSIFRISFQVSTSKNKTQNWKNKKPTVHVKDTFIFIKQKKSKNVVIKHMFKGTKHKQTFYNSVCFEL